MNSSGASCPGFLWTQLSCSTMEYPSHPFPVFQDMPLVKIYSSPANHPRHVPRRSRSWQARRCPHVFLHGNTLLSMDKVLHIFLCTDLSPRIRLRSHRQTGGMHHQQACINLHSSRPCQVARYCPSNTPSDTGQDKGRAWISMDLLSMIISGQRHEIHTHPGIHLAQIKHYFRAKYPATKLPIALR